MDINDQDKLNLQSLQEIEGKHSNLDKFIDLIQKEPNMRPDFSCQEFIPFLKKHIQWFNTLQSDLIKEIIKRCRFLKVPPETVFFKQGEIGESMYAVLRGKLSVHVIFDSENDRDCLSRVEAVVGKKKLNKADLGNEVAQIAEGICIGEVALLNENCMRTASCVSTTTCDFLVIDRALYSVSVKELIEKEFHDKTQFVQRNPLFESWTPRQKNQLIISLRKTKVRFGEKLVRQGQELDVVYFIYKGEMEIHIDVKQYQKQYSTLYSEMTTLLPELVKGTTKEHLAPHMLRKERMTRNKTQRVCFVGANETIGSLEAIINLDTYMESAVSHGECELVTMKKSQFEKTFQKRFASLTLDKMKEALANKLCLYMYQCDPGNVAFLKFLNMKLMDSQVLQEVKRSKYGRARSSRARSERAGSVAERQEIVNVLKKLHMSSEDTMDLPPEDKTEIALAKMDRRLRMWGESTNMNGSKLAELQSATITLANDRNIV